MRNRRVIRLFEPMPSFKTYRLTTALVLTCVAVLVAAVATTPEAVVVVLIILRPNTGFPVPRRTTPLAGIVFNAAVRSFTKCVN